MSLDEQALLLLDIHPSKLRRLNPESFSSLDQTIGESLPGTPAAPDAGLAARHSNAEGVTMADFGASYGEMEAMANKLSDARDDIQGQLDQLKSSVDSLLGNDFKTQHASGKFGQGYEELTTGLKSAVDGIGEMGEALRGMMQAIQDLDHQLAGG